MTELETRDLGWARKITERLRLQATNYQEAREKVMTTLREAQEGGAAELLGYASWTAYVSDVLGDAPLRLERDQRAELAAELTAQGMSTRAVAPILGVNQKTVVNDIRRTEEISSVEDDPLGPMTLERVYGADKTAGQEGRQITGLNGKQYIVPETRKPNRRALTDVARDAGWDIRKAVEKLERIREDDRYSRNEEEVATLLRGHLMYVIETCQGFLDDFDKSKGD